MWINMAQQWEDPIIGAFWRGTMEFRKVRLTALLLGRHMELLRTTSSWVTKTFRKHGDRRQRVLPAPAPDTSSCQGSFAIIDLEKAPTRSSSCWKHIILLSYVRSIKSNILCLLRILWKLSRNFVTYLMKTCVPAPIFSPARPHRAAGRGGREWNELASLEKWKYWS